MGTSVKVQGMEQAIRAVERDLYRETHAKAQRATEKLIADARYKWPVNKRDNRPPRPHSRDLFRVEDRSDGGDRVRFVIQNDARDEQGTPYAFFIKTHQHGLGYKSPWTVLIRRPLGKAVKVLARDIVSFPVGD